MTEIFDKIKDNPLFAGIDAGSFGQMLSCVEGRVKLYLKNELILLAGDPVNTVGLVISGRAQIVRENTEGKQNLMAELQEGDLFGEVFACADVSHSPVTVIAAQDCQVLHLRYKKIITTCPSVCPFHTRLIGNMLTLMAHKNLMLNQKIEILSKRTTRERLLLYFEIQRRGASRFTIPLSREELAAYLCVERSAMSAELSRMQKDGLIRYQKNEIEWLNSKE
ncbi:MAG: Crp/Fnr family transcriptional regulator [Clostridium sp.]|nr:Crp/Fnr family transcriptional regulator [Clostridium sp.]